MSFTILHRQGQYWIHPTSNGLVYSATAGPFDSKEDAETGILVLEGDDESA